MPCSQDAVQMKVNKNVGPACVFLLLLVFTAGLGIVPANAKLHQVAPPSWWSTPTPTPTCASANGTTATPAASVTDSVCNVWTVSGGNAFMNGVYANGGGSELL